jgi:Ca2+-binding RTX toxin-like protein
MVMKIHFIFQLVIFGLVMMVLIGISTAIAATNTVPSTRLDNQIKTITANDVKPFFCASLNLQNIIVGSGIITGTSGNDLILGSTNNDTINGQDGTDCILGGGGGDTISGENGSDVCDGGGNAGDIFATCETIIP